MDETQGEMEFDVLVSCYKRAGCVGGFFFINNVISASAKILFVCLSGMSCCDVGIDVRISRSSSYHIFKPISHI